VGDSLQRVGAATSSAAHDAAGARSLSLAFSGTANGAHKYTKGATAMSSKTKHVDLTYESPSAAGATGAAATALTLAAASASSLPLPLDSVAVLPEAGDNCAIARRPILAGTRVVLPESLGGHMLTLPHIVLEGHRFASAWRRSARARTRAHVRRAQQPLSRASHSPRTRSQSPRSPRAQCCDRGGCRLAPR
jgi:hypothetical protein